MASINSLSTYSQKRFHIPIFFAHNSDSILFLRSQRFPSHQTDLHCLTKKHCNVVAKSEPNLGTSIKAFPISPLKKIPVFLVERVVVFLIGSAIFLGCYRIRPSLALLCSSCEGFTEEKGTRDEGSGCGQRQDEEKGDKKEEDAEREKEELYKKLLEREPRNVEALKVLLCMKLRSDEVKEALGYAQRLMKIEPEEDEWILFQGLCYHSMGELSKAKIMFKGLLERNPLMLRALHGLAMSMHEDDEGPAVFEMLNKAKELARREKKVTEERNIRLLEAQMHLVKWDLEVGKKKFEDLAQEEPRDFRPYFALGIIYSLLDEIRHADAYFEVYEELVPEDFPEKKFLDDVVLAAKSKSGEEIQKEFRAKFAKQKTK